MSHSKRSAGKKDKKKKKEGKNGFFLGQMCGMKGSFIKKILDFSFNSTELWLLISSVGYNRKIKVTKNKKKKKNIDLIHAGNLDKNSKCKKLQ